MPYLKKGMLSLFLLLCAPAAVDAAHLSPFSYIERGVHQLVCFTVCIIHIYKSEGLPAFDPRNLISRKDKRLKFIVMAMLLCSQFLFIMFDLGYCMVFKYGEGWSANCNTGIDYVLDNLVTYPLPDSAYEAMGNYNWTDTTPAISLATLNALRGGISETHFLGKPDFMRFGDPDDNDPAAGCVIGIQPASAYHQENHERKEIANTLLSASWTLQSSGMFIFIAWISQITKHTLDGKMLAGLAGRESFHTGGLGSRSRNSGILGSFVRGKGFQASFMGTNESVGPAFRGTARYWEVKAAEVYSVISIIMYGILPTFFEDPLVKIVAPQLVGTIEWTLLAIIIFITRRRIGLIIDTLSHGTGLSERYTILTRMHHLLGYSMMMLVLQAFGMGMMDWDIVHWHQSFTGKSAHGRKYVFDTSHPLRTDLMTAIYSTGFALIPLPVVYIMYTGSREKMLRDRVVQSTAGKLKAAQDQADDEKRKLLSEAVKVKGKLESQVGHLESEAAHLKHEIHRLKYSQNEIKCMQRARQTMTQESQNELREVLISSEDVETGPLIGKGGFGSIHQGEYEGEIVAIKQLQHLEDDTVDRFRFECFLMKSLRHPNVVRLIGVCWDDNMLACVLEYVPNGCLQDHLSRQNSDLRWRSHLLHTAQELSMSLEYLHHSRYWHEKKGDNGKPGWRECIIHRDVKPENILMTADWSMKLADFGESRAVDKAYHMTMVGTPLFTAPEILRGDRYDAKVDTYSFAITILAMVRGEKKIIDYFMQALRKAMRRKNAEGVGIVILNYRMNAKKWRPLLPLGLLKTYPKLSKLITDCWADDPKSRPSFSKIRKLLHAEISTEVNNNPEPMITRLSEEDDEVYIHRLQHGDDKYLLVEEDGEDGKDLE
eukprot:CAMPEP_0118656516 /NCGR_PEP_ID=MMETSP0785-20121206/13529_1 /TAXON_ID=91992 /ORGANISM="Bolidomonas pacifica, Strain CCMP 1866" /LENGTH=882 /DNA_ID=CAMNT_0006549377 /DNA_START=68 /DNA_END=2713 /DNA_ORIENTATION=-